MGDRPPQTEITFLRISRACSRLSAPSGRFMACHRSCPPRGSGPSSRPSFASVIIDDILSIVERGTPTLGDPTHGVIVGRSFFYIANSGWDTLDDHGALKPDAKLTPPRLMRVALP